MELSVKETEHGYIVVVKSGGSGFYTPYRSDPKWVTASQDHLNEICRRLGRVSDEHLIGCKFDEQ